MVAPKIELQLHKLAPLARNNPSDPIRYYSWPIIGRLYRQRVELCLQECRGGERILEVGFGIGLTFPYLATRYHEIFGIDLMADTAGVGRYFDQLEIKTDLRNGNVLNMPYPDGLFDTVLLISILEHLQPAEQDPVMREIGRVLKPGGQMVYGVPVERPFMVMLYRLMGVNIRELHFSTEQQVSQAADRAFRRVALNDMTSSVPGLGAIYQIGHYAK